MSSGNLVEELEYRLPFEWNPLRTFLVGRASSGVEAIEGETYLRTVALGDGRGWLRVSPHAKNPTLQVELSHSLAPRVPEVLAKVRRLFDLDADTEMIAAHLGAVACGRPGVRVPGAFDGYEMAVRAILGQQISVQAATTLAGRFAAKFGEKAETPFPQLTHYSPKAERVASAEAEEIIALGIISNRANSILRLSQEVASGTLSLEPDADPETTIMQLCELPGIGEWTAQCVAMRALGHADAFPHTDLGIKKALGETNPRRILERAEAWKPYRAYATMHLWKSLEKTA